MANNNERKHFLNPLGGIYESVLKSDKNVAFITIAATTSTSGAGSTRIRLAKAPITGVDIRQITDYSITKSLSRDFLVATFGDAPVSIQLKGVSFFNLGAFGCENLGSTGTGALQEDITEFYNKNKLSANKNARFDIAIANSTGGPATAFRCVLLGLDLSNNTRSETGLFTCDYTLSLIGVKK